MRIGSYHVDGRLVAALGIGLLALGLFLWPWSRPQDETVRLHVHPEYNTIQRKLITAKTRPPRDPWGRHGVIAYNARSVTLKSDGAEFDAYVLDLAGLDPEAQGEFFLETSRRIEAGEDVAESSKIVKRLGVKETSIGLAWIPFGMRANYMLIVHGKEPTEVTATISYGGPPAS